MCVGVAYLKTSTETPDIREQKPVILEFAIVICVLDTPIREVRMVKASWSASHACYTVRHNERSKEYVRFAQQFSFAKPLFNRPLLVSPAVGNPVH
ncbi:hypothetical protein H8E77_02830 [bacterium]|nr:hypothetical protein [bacterium]